MAYTQTQLDKIEAAIAKGVTSMRLNGRVVEYRSLKEMIAVRDEMRAELGVAVSSKTQSRIFTVTASKGL